ncbi:MAG: cyclase family protein [Longimicrobiales bacterium]
MKRARVRDISMPVSARTAVWPGDRTFAIDWTLRRERGDSVNVAAVSLSTHTGTHVDGPLHVVDGGAPIGLADLAALVGPARVVDARGHERLDASALPPDTLRTAERLLFRTRAASRPEQFPDTFAAFTPELARTLAAAGVRLVGTDAPSVDPFGSTTLDAHRAFIGGGIAIVENLVLDDVAPGDYFLVVLPLKLLDADSSPARAVLIDGF